MTKNNPEDLLDYIFEISESYFGIMSDGKMACLNISNKDVDRLLDSVTVYKDGFFTNDQSFFTLPYGKLLVNIELEDGKKPVITPIKNQ